MSLVFVQVQFAQFVKDEEASSIKEAHIVFEVVFALAPNTFMLPAKHSP